MIKVLYLNPSSHLGGAEWVLHDVVTHLDRARFEPVVALPKEGPLATSLRAAGIDVRVIGSFAPLLKLGRYSRWRDYLQISPALVDALRGGRELCRLIQDEGVAIIHANGIKAHVLSALLRPKLRLPIIWHVHDFIGRRRFHRLYRYLAGRVPSLLIANSRAVAADLGLGVNVIVVYNGVDLRRFSPIRGSTGGEPYHVGMIGVLAPWKGHGVFLEAARRVSAKLPNVQFWIVGDEIYDTDGHRGYRRRLEERVREAGLHERVRFTGFCRDVTRIINELDIVVHASIEPEPFGRVLIEAMACGKPVIASRAGGVPEIVEHEINGLLVAPGDGGQLADTIVRLLNDAAERERLGEAGRRRVEERFSLAEQVERIQRIYESLWPSNERGRADRVPTAHR
ncbi:MAG: glycosyltransferase family 1 protein [Acidobacteria bacterium]|nr:MAG: glycosyltransferase family 1 protein [Acidobacteriota bacterium]